MTDEIGNFTDAIRAVLRDTADRSNMRGLARTAVERLPQHLLIEAATAHLTSLARRLHNESARAGTADSPVSAEVVVLHGRDQQLGLTTSSDRQQLADSRERLARGLMRRAEQLRTFSEAPTVHVGAVSVSDLAAAERRAASLERMLSTLDALTAGADSFASRIDSQLSELDVSTSTVRAQRERLRGLATRVADAGVFGFRYTKGSRRRVLEVFGLPDSASTVEEYAVSERAQKKRKGR